MKSDIRLLLTEQCNRFCPDCCNQKPQHDLDNLPQFNLHAAVNATSITISGGEPMLDPLELMYAARTIQQVNPDCLIYLYTAKTRPPAPLIAVLDYFHGVTITLHEPKDVKDFSNFLDWMNFRPGWKYGKSLRLNYFPEEGIVLDELYAKHKSQLQHWIVEELEWLDDCPLPENETFMRWAPPTVKEHNYRRAYNERNGLLHLHQVPA